MRLAFWRRRRVLPAEELKRIDAESLDAVRKSGELAGASGAVEVMRLKHQKRAALAAETVLAEMGIAEEKRQGIRPMVESFERWRQMAARAYKGAEYRQQVLPEKARLQAGIAEIIGEKQAARLVREISKTKGIQWQAARKNLQVF